jgi:hypothetical protein
MLLHIYRLSLFTLAIGLLSFQYVVKADAEQSDRYNHLRAGELREESAARAREQLRSPRLLPDDSEHQKDYSALSAQIQRLGEMVDAMEQESASALPSSAPPSTPPNPATISELAQHTPAEVKQKWLEAIYGPTGVTVEAVEIILKYSLLLVGNPRLRIGTIIESEQQIQAKITTPEGSVVEEFVIDKTSGAWSPVR